MYCMLLPHRAWAGNAEAGMMMHSVLSVEDFRLVMSWAEFLCPRIFERSMRCTVSFWCQAAWFPIAVVLRKHPAYQYEEAEGSVNLV